MKNKTPHRLHQFLKNSFVQLFFAYVFAFLIVYLAWMKTQFG
jgi:hypothetical protein